MSVTHVAAQAIVVEGRYMRQRCAWCGDILIDHDLTRLQVALTPGQTEVPPPADFPTGRFVTHDGPMWLVLDEDAIPPEDCCLWQHPDVTGT